MTDTWGWWAQGASSESGVSPGTDIQSNYNGFTFNIGGNTTAHGYGDMAMVDGDGDGNLSAVQANGSPAPGNGDRFTTPDGVDRQIFEVRIFDDSVYTYTDADGALQTYVTRAVVYQIGNGDLVVRMRDDDSNAAPEDFRYQNVTSVELGTWDGAQYISTVVSNFDEFPPNVCFVSGTLIATAYGQVAVEDIKTGDLVVTRDAGLQPVRWIGSRRLETETLARHPRLRPIRIRAGALGEGKPSSDLLVSPQHRVLVRSKIAQNMFGTSEVLVAAKQLLSIDGIDVATDVTQVDYVHFLMDEHQVVVSNGAETESLYTGPQALKSVGPAEREEIFLIFPELRDREPGQQPEGARTLLTGRQGREMAERHARKSRALVS